MKSKKGHDITNNGFDNSLVLNDNIGLAYSKVKDDDKCWFCHRTKKEIVDVLYESFNQFISKKNLERYNWFENRDGHFCSNFKVCPVCYGLKGLIFSHGMVDQGFTEYVNDIITDYLDENQNKLKIIFVKKGDR